MRPTNGNRHSVCSKIVVKYPSDFIPFPVLVLEFFFDCRAHFVRPVWSAGHFTGPRSQPDSYWTPLEHHKVASTVPCSVSVQYIITAYRSVLFRREAVNPGGECHSNRQRCSARTQVGLSAGAFIFRSKKDKRTCIISAKYLINSFNFNIVWLCTQQNLKLGTNLKMSFYERETVLSIKRTGLQSSSCDSSSNNSQLSQYLSLSCSRLPIKWENEEIK